MDLGRAREWLKHIVTRQLTCRLRFEGPIAVTPVSNVFGLDRGTPLDRVFIERFLARHQHLIRGDCLEVGDTAYTRQFGRPGFVATALKFSTSPSAREGSAGELVADLTRPETMPECRFDAFICTQTLNFIYDLAPVMASIYKLLKPGGHALITVAGICQISRYDSDRWGDYWRFTEQSLIKLMTSQFDKELCTTEAFGNVAAACLFLQGLACEDLPDQSLLDPVDKNYQMTVCGLAMKAK